MHASVTLRARTSLRRLAHRLGLTATTHSESDSREHPHGRFVTTWAQALDWNRAIAQSFLSGSGVDSIDLPSRYPQAFRFGVATHDRSKLFSTWFSNPDLSEVSLAYDADGVRIRCRARNLRLEDQKGLLSAEEWVVYQPLAFGVKGPGIGSKAGCRIAFLAREDLGRPVRSSPAGRPVGAAQTVRNIEEVPFPIDVVYLWVDDTDPLWRERKADRFAGVQDGNSELAQDAIAPSSFRNRDELRYSLRSIETFAPWVRNIFVVTDRQRPSWLTESDRVRIIDHMQILPADVLPTFNSNVIDIGLHRIPGLSEHFLIFNDDVLLWSPVAPEDFFSSAGLMKVFLSRARIPASDALPGDKVVDAAAKNIRALILEQHGVTITQKFKHIPVPQTVSLRARVANLYAPAVEATLHQPFRSINDISFAHLVAYEAVIEGLGFLANLAYDYVGIGSPGWEGRIRQRLRHWHEIKVLCVNEHAIWITDNQGPNRSASSAELDLGDMLPSLLAAHLPNPAPWEKPY